MNTNLQDKTLKDSVSLNFGDSNLIVNKKDLQLAAALTSQREILSKTNSNTKRDDICYPLQKSKDTTPRLQVSVDFAAEQWLQIVLIHLNSKNKSLSGVLEPIGGCHLGLTSGI